MTRALALSACALMILSRPGPLAHAGGPHSARVVPVAPGVSPGVAVPTAFAEPFPTSISARRPYLGTFRPDPTLVSYTGPGTTGAYTPAGIPRGYAAMSIYGPFSRLRALPEEVVTYSRGYDGVLRPTSTGISLEYTDPRLYRDTGLIPTGFQYNRSTGARRNPGFGRYLLGQE